ncbi:hypothetical protein BU23DRAFT_160133 [Bimuria novae-zelandiae CBS 107.79]|uniref:Uncharacterized protein n=1 Tax=Bimuria novae-zelandiae CBS 107.79 TaxID=1447943 RepID=A0A6A5V5X6_9PLEO|nr:hypothetical protein BU23DRAFT_160133 [Bimuria novae-zelandiae CBS 107.79]
MASNVQPPAQREPPKQPAAPHPVENLQAMMNLVLITSGRYMKTVKQAPAESAKMQFQLKRAVTAGSERFHDSLDELETEIRMAQAVLRRDLAQMRAERRHKEAAAKEKEAEKARQAAEPKTAAPKKEEVAPPPAPAKSATPPPIKEEPSAPVPPVKVEPVAEKASTPKAPTPPSEDVHMESTENLNTAQDSEFDFDAMFGDSAMDTSGDAGNDQGELNLDATADLDFTLNDQPDQPDQPDLLRGLEDFAKGGADDTSGQNNASTSLDLDFNMTDLPDMNANAPVEQPATTKQEDTPAQQPTTTEELNLGNTTPDNLDDLFDMDDYTNPEDTQFDDAFYGFDES